MPNPRRNPFRRPLLWTLLLAAPASAAPRTGEQIYVKQCASCHGPAGEGTKELYPHELAGDKSVPQLARLIGKTMPEDDPGSLSKEDAEKVAAYVHGAFYSKEARERNKPPRVELSRLTVRQYRNAVADLVGSFRGPVKWDGGGGLKAAYSRGRRSGRQGGQGGVERVDPQVNFDWGTGSPAPGTIEAHEFSARWEGSVLAPETGDYEFIVRTEHATRLWVNDTERPLIDAWVKSGNDTEYRASLFLIGGRPYPLRLEFSKAKQGVDDSKKRKGPPPSRPASMALLWKLPVRAAEPVPARHLSPERAPEAFVVATPFPPDDRSYGWERSTTISKAWAQAATDAALDTAGYVADRLDELLGIQPAGRGRRGPGSGNPSEISFDRPKGAGPPPDRAEKVRQFARSFVERAFRRPLTEEQKKLYVDSQFEGAPNAEVAVKRVVILALKSPRFLYREVAGGSDAHDVAARLAFALWDSLPDQELLNAASSGRLKDRAEVVKQAERMLADPRAHAKVNEFLLTWLKVDHAPDVAKDPKRFPGFDAAIVSDLRTSLELFLDEALWKGDADFRRLLLADDLHLNGRLAKFYGAELPPDPRSRALILTGPWLARFIENDAPFQKVKLNPERRAGVLTHPYLMTAFAYTGSTSPIHRGVFLARGVLGLSLRPPPEAFTPLPEDLHPNLTTRERVALQTRPAACVSCHSIINPLGFTLENFDAVGRYRERDNGKPVDATGAYQTKSGDTVTFAGIRDLAKYLAGSEEVHAAFAEQLFHHLVKQPVRAYGKQRHEELRRSFAENGFNVRKLAVEIATVAALNENSSFRPKR